VTLDGAILSLVVLGLVFGLLSCSMVVWDAWGRPYGPSRLGLAVASIVLGAFCWAGALLLVAAMPA
jgi:hypothetical protein